MEVLKKRNRTLLEMHIGILFWGVLCQIVGAFFVEDQLFYAKSLWFGILLAIVGTIHMYRTLDRALDYTEKTATKTIFSGYLTRYVLIVVILSIIMITEVMNPLIVFLAYMGLKVTAFFQPITHKLCNKLFHETDPIPQPIVEESGRENDAEKIVCKDNLSKEEAVNGKIDE